MNTVALSLLFQVFTALMAAPLPSFSLLLCLMIYPVKEHVDRSLELLARILPYVPCSGPIIGDIQSYFSKTSGFHRP